eukprot:gene13496-18107_t
MEEYFHDASFSDDLSLASTISSGIARKIPEFVSNPSGTIHQLGSKDDDISIPSSRGGSVLSDSDFRIPLLKANNLGRSTNEINLAIKKDQRVKMIQREIEIENKKHRYLDKLAKISDEALLDNKFNRLSESSLRRMRVGIQAKGELDLVKHVIQRKPGHILDRLQFTDVDYIANESSIDHPKIGSIQEKMEDLRQESIEEWCMKHGKLLFEKKSNKNKRMLRKWFIELDNDNSGEVSVNELQDSLLSSGIFRTREQVVRVLANVDQNNSMGIDFEEFYVALTSNQFADQDRIQSLQEMSNNEFGFAMETLLTNERRKKLFESIVKECERRQREIDKLFRKYDPRKHRMHKRDRELFVAELETLEEKQTKAMYLRSKYVNSLNGVLLEKRNVLTNQDEKELEEISNRKPHHAVQTFHEIHSTHSSHSKYINNPNNLSNNGSLSSSSTIESMYSHHHKSSQPLSLPSINNHSSVDPGIGMVSPIYKHGVATSYVDSPTHHTHISSTYTTHSHSPAVTAAMIRAQHRFDPSPIDKSIIFQHNNHAPESKNIHHLRTRAHLLYAPPSPSNTIYSSKTANQPR